jgi:glycosyltransferase involved in cell wall biosynthesis
MHVAVIAIGRNEGERLRRCLRSLMGRVAEVVYVDSSSSDDSVSWARSQGVDVVELDMSLPFTAARARNAGLRRLVEASPEIEVVQFVDGDCEVAAGWIETGAAYLRDHPEVCVVCGRRRERERNRTVYNRLCDLEWDGPTGEVRSCGGDAMMRVRPLLEVGGYDETFIAGEEPELCVRLRARGWKVVRLPVEMTLHDANMTRFRQWWRRTKRSGHAYAEGMAVHGRPPERHNVKEVRSILAWGLAAPLVAIAGLIGAVWDVRLLAALGLVLLGYGALWVRVTRARRRRGDSWPDSRLYGAACVLSKFPQVVGVGMYWWGRLRKRRVKLIEYKGPGSAEVQAAAAQEVAR